VGRAFSNLIDESRLIDTCWSTQTQTCLLLKVPCKLIAIRGCDLTETTQRHMWQSPPFSFEPTLWRAQYHFPKQCTNERATEGSSVLIARGKPVSNTGSGKNCARS
jgi:hypothetical protein